MILSVTFIEGVDLEEREVWRGIILTEAEACGILDGLSDGADDVAARVGGRLISQAKKRSGGDE